MVLRVYFCMDSHHVWTENLFCKGGGGGGGGGAFGFKDSQLDQVRKKIPL